MKRLQTALAENNASLTLVKNQFKIVSLDVASDPEYFTAISYDVTLMSQSLESLNDQIRYSIQPDAWDDTNGDTTLDGTIINGRTILTLNGSYDMHLETRHYLRGIFRLSGKSINQIPQLAGATGNGSRVVRMPGEEGLSNRQFKNRRKKAGAGIGGFGGGGGVF